MNIAQTLHKRWSFPLRISSFFVQRNWLHKVHIFNKKHLLLHCVVYRLTPLFLIQAMDLFFWGTQKQLFPDVQMFFKISVLKIFETFTRKHLRLESFKITLQPFRPKTLLKRNSNTGVFVWSFPNFNNISFYRRALVAASGIRVCIEARLKNVLARDETCYRSVFITQSNI